MIQCANTFNLRDKKKTHKNIWLFIRPHILLQELPKAEALLQTREINENNLQNLDKDIKKKDDKKADQDSDSSSESDTESDSSFSDSDESAELNRVHIKLPLELDLSDLASAILENNQK